MCDKPQSRDDSSERGNSHRQDLTLSETVQEGGFSRLETPHHRDIKTSCRRENLCRAREPLRKLSANLFNVLSKLHGFFSQQSGKGCPESIRRAASRRIAPQPKRGDLVG